MLSDPEDILSEWMSKWLLSYQTDGCTDMRTDGHKVKSAKVASCLKQFVYMDK